MLGSAKINVYQNKSVGEFSPIQTIVCQICPNIGAKTTPPRLHAYIQDEIAQLLRSCGISGFFLSTLAYLGFRCFRLAVPVSCYFPCVLGSVAAFQIMHQMFHAWKIYLHSQNLNYYEHLGCEFVHVYFFSTSNLGSNTNASSSAPNHSSNITGLFDTCLNPKP